VLRASAGTYDVKTDFLKAFNTPTCNNGSGQPRLAHVSGDGRHLLLHYRDGSAGSLSVMELPTGAVWKTTLPVGAAGAARFVAGDRYVAVLMPGATPKPVVRFHPFDPANKKIGSVPLVSEALSAGAEALVTTRSSPGGASDDVLFVFVRTTAGDLIISYLVTAGSAGTGPEVKKDYLISLSKSCSSNACKPVSMHALDRHNVLLVRPDLPDQVMMADLSTGKITYPKTKPTKARLVTASREHVFYSTRSPSNKIAVCYLPRAQFTTATEACGNAAGTTMAKDAVSLTATPEGKHVYLTSSNENAALWEYSMLASWGFPQRYSLAVKGASVLVQP